MRRGRAQPLPNALPLVLPLSYIPQQLQDQVAALSAFPVAPTSQERTRKRKRSSSTSPSINHSTSPFTCACPSTMTSKSSTTAHPVPPPPPPPPPQDYNSYGPNMMDQSHPPNPPMPVLQQPPQFGH